MSKINNTTAYPIVSPAIGDLVILSDVSDSKSTKNFQIGALNDLFIDTFVNPDATDFYIPVFNQGGVRITNSIMSQDSSPSNGVDGTKITIAGNLEINGIAELDNNSADFSVPINVTNANQSSFAGQVTIPTTPVAATDAASKAYVDEQNEEQVSGSGTANYLPLWTDTETLSDSGFYQVPSGANITNAIGLNTTKLDSFYGEYPELRVASRQTNDPGVLDLFRPDGDVQAGDKVGVLQYSIDDDAQYAVAQIEVETLNQAGTGNSGGGKLCFKTSTSFPGAQPTERLCIDNTEADFSVPINVTNANQSSFVGQVTIPTTPVAATDAASKAYVDSQSGGGGIAQTTGNYTPQIIANTPSEWVISSYSIQQGKWVRTGNLIHCDFYISISASNISGNTGGTSSLSIQGWPYNYEGNINDDYQDGNLVSANGFDVKMQSFDISVGSGLGNAKLSLNKQNTAVTNYYIETPMQTGDLNNGNSINIRGSFSYTTSNTTLNPGATIDP